MQTASDIISPIKTKLRGKKYIFMTLQDTRGTNKIKHNTKLHYSAGERERDGLLLRLGLCFLGLMLAFLLGGGYKK